MNSQTKQPRFVQLRLKHGQVRHLALVIKSQIDYKIRLLEKLEKLEETKQHKKLAEKYRHQIEGSQVIFSKLISAYHQDNFER